MKSFQSYYLYAVYTDDRVLRISMQYLKFRCAKILSENRLISNNFPAAHKINAALWIVVIYSYAIYEK